MDTPAAIALPLRTDPDGTIRVGNTRVILDLVIYAFRQGATAETIVEQYPALALADVYLVLGYYLHHRENIDAYILKREAEAQGLRREIEAHFPPEGLRARLLARMETQKKAPF